jgi:hypothetical protein
MENLQKTLRNLRLPDSFGKFDGIISTRTSRVLIQERVHDYTQMTRINGKSVPKVIDTFKIEESKSAFDTYALNMLDWELHSRNVEVKLESEDEVIFGRDKFFSTIEIGPFTGNTYWYTGINSSITETLDGTYIFDKVIDLGLSSDTKGNPEPTLGENPLVTVVRREFIKTRTSLSKPIVSYPKIALYDILSAMGKTKDELKYDMRTTFLIVPKAQLPLNKICNTSIEAVFTMNEDGSILADAKVYYDGIDTQVTRPTGKITSYNKQYPGHVVRWRLYDGIVNDYVYGSSATIVFNSLVDDKITIVAGNETKYDALTKTLTYNKEDGATLWVTFEEQPAQGKGWGNEAMYFLLEDAEPIRI